MENIIEETTAVDTLYISVEELSAELSRQSLRYEKPFEEESRAVFR
ncbi:MAG: hypothetical protein PUB41_03620 [bacterium]|nr:hypothetical protein [bacterium]MDD6225325.1 hypothetical protein [bacterium]